MYVHVEVQVDLNREILVDLSGWAVLKEATQLYENGCVKHFRWDQKSISGEVSSGAVLFKPTLNLRSLTFASNRCSCVQGRRGNVCAHAVALCLASIDGVSQPLGEQEASEDSVVLEDEETVCVKSLVLSESKGIPGRFVMLLPPNYAVAAAKDRIALRVEFELATGQRQLLETLDRGRAYRLEEWDQRLGGAVEKLCGGKLHSNLQLTREQFLALLNGVEGKGFVAWLRTPATAIEWGGDGTLAGVHSELKLSQDHSPRPTTARAGPSEIRRLRPPSIDTSANVRLQRTQVDGSPHFLALTLPSREDPSHDAILELLKQWRFKLEPSNGKWWLRDGHRVLNFLADHLDDFKTRFQAEFSENFRQRLGHLQKLDLDASVAESGRGFELKLGLSGDLSPTELNEQVMKGRRYVEKDGSIFLVSEQKLSALEQLSRKLSGPGKSTAQGRVGVPLNAAFHDLCDWETILDDAGVNWTAPETWKLRSSAIRNLSKLSEAPVEASLYDRLRLYQKIGVAWMFHLYRHQLAGILADEMGLGKTVQAIALLTAVQAEEVGGVSLIVCPAGLMGNWKREFSQFAPQLKVHVHHGSGRSDDSERWSEAWDVILTSYSTLARDQKLFGALKWKFIIGDEAQHIKNRKTRHAKSLKQLRSDGRFLLTGTPIENSVEDLISMFEFLLPGYLEKAPPSVTKTEDRQWEMQRIRERAAHYLLRRTKKQVAPELPEKLEQVIYCDMEAAQQDLYEQYRRSSSLAIEKLEGSGASEGRVRMAMFTELLRLRQICADPRLLDAEMDASVSCKLGVFRELLEECMDGGNRMLVFSQFVGVLQLLKQELTHAGIPFAYIDGQTKDRLREADRFNQDATIPVFLISLKAGGTGLNLTGADTVLHFDPWWNPAAEAQATDRAHRIGQTRTVTSIRLIVSGSVEEKVQVMQQQKQKLLLELFDESAVTSAKFELSEVKALLES